LKFVQYRAIEVAFLVLAHPLGQQCTATAKATGKQCERRAIGSPVCIMHGGKARQVKAKAEQRVMVAELEAKAAAQTVVVRREPEELILDALHDTNAVLTRIKADLHDGVVNPILLQLAGDWLDRLGRLGKIITDGDLTTKLHTRIGWVAQDRAATLWGHLAAVVEASPLTAEQRLTVWQSRFDGLRLIASGDLPFRLSDDALHRFSDRLMEAAAVEQAAVQAAADGIVWDDSESDSDSDGGVGSLVLFPSSDGDGFRR
jgi:hypothetical protein